MIKMMILAPRRAGMSHAEFRRYVTGVHGPLVKSVTEVAADIRRYHYNFPVADAATSALHLPAASYDIVTEAWFDSIEAQRRNMQHPRYMQVLRPDEHRFANGERAIIHYTNEHTVIDGEHTRWRLFLFRRRHPALTRAAFQAEWLERMSQLITSAAACKAWVSCYVQNHVAAESEHPDGTDSKYFDVIDQYFLRHEPQQTDLAAVAAAMRQLEGQCLDVSRSCALVAEVVQSI